MGAQASRMATPDGAPPRGRGIPFEKAKELEELGRARENELCSELREVRSRLAAREEEIEATRKAIAQLEGQAEESALANQHLSRLEARFQEQQASTDEKVAKLLEAVAEEKRRAEAAEKGRDAAREQAERDARTAAQSWEEQRALRIRVEELCDRKEEEVVALREQLLARGASNPEVQALRERLAEEQKATAELEARAAERDRELQVLQDAARGGGRLPVVREGSKEDMTPQAGDEQLPEILDGQWSRQESPWSRQESCWSRQESGGSRQESGWPRQESGWSRQVSPQCWSRQETAQAVEAELMRQEQTAEELRRQLAEERRQGELFAQQALEHKRRLADFEERKANADANENSLPSGFMERLVKGELEVCKLQEQLIHEIAIRSETQRAYRDAQRMACRLKRRLQAVSVYSSEGKKEDEKVVPVTTLKDLQLDEPEQEQSPNASEPRRTASSPGCAIRKPRRRSAGPPEKASAISPAPRTSRYRRRSAEPPTSARGAAGPGAHLAPPPAAPRRSAASPVAAGPAPAGVHRRLSSSATAGVLREVGDGEAVGLKTPPVPESSRRSVAPVGVAPPAAVQPLQPAGVRGGASSSVLRGSASPFSGRGPMLARLGRSPSGAGGARTPTRAGAPCAAAPATVVVSPQLPVRVIRGGSSPEATKRSATAGQAPRPSAQPSARPYAYTPMTKTGAVAGQQEQPVCRMASAQARPVVLHTMRAEV